MPVISDYMLRSSHKTAPRVPAAEAFDLPSEESGESQSSGLSSSPPSSLYTVTPKAQRPAGSTYGSLPPSPTPVISSVPICRVLGPDGRPWRIPDGYQDGKNWRKRRGKSSHIWEHGVRLTQRIDGQVYERWACRLCIEKGEKPPIMATTSTNHQADHLRDSHQVMKSGKLSNSVTLHRMAMKASDDSYRLFRPVAKQRLQQMLLRFKVAAQLNDSQLISPELRELLIDMNPAAEPHIPLSRSTVRGWMTAAVKHAKQVCQP